MTVTSNGSVLNDSILCNISNDDWQHISVTVSGTALETRLQSSTCLHSASSSLTLVQPLASVIFLGSLQNFVADFVRLSTAVKSTSGINGCVRNVTINGVLQDLQSPSISYSDHDPPSATAGCRRDEMCAANPCRNGGVCVAHWMGYNCDCQTDYQGAVCEEVAPASFNGNASVAQFKVHESVGFSATSGSLSFRTRDFDGTLLHAGWQPTSIGRTTDDYFSLEIAGGHVNLAVHLGQGSCCNCMCSFM